MHYSTVFDIFGEEFYVINSRHNDKFNIDILYGREIGSQSKSAKIIFTETLKRVLLENKSLSKKKFGIHLSESVIVKLRRRLKQNPYESFEQWAESTDPEKPREVTFINTKEKSEIFTDYFGVQYILFSARIAPNGIIIIIGKPLEEYKLNKNGRRFVFTKELVDFIQNYRYDPSWVCKELSVHPKVFIDMRKELGYNDSSNNNMNMWLAAHLVEITSMTIQAFIENYLQEVTVAKGSIIRNVKRSFHAMKQFRDSPEKEIRKNLYILRTLDTKKSSEVLKLLREKMHYETARRCVQTYKILMLAQKYKHPIPKELKGILKKKRLQ
jgi:hypothetical protein